MEFNLLIGGNWTDSADGGTEDVHSPYDNRKVGRVAVASAEDVAAALTFAEDGAAFWRRTPAHERAAVLNRAADLLDERAGRIAQVLSSESGKPITDARNETSRSGAIARLAAHEGSQLYGQTLPLDANRGTGLDKIGFTLPQPVGIVVAITPFNFPSLLVMHKIAPALAAGNSVILKPARTTPLTALLIAECFVDAGAPEGVLSVLTGSGSKLGDQLIADSRVRKVSFTGSTEVGKHITEIAGVKKLSLELGSSAPTVVLKDADVKAAAKAVATGGYSNAGQVCISVQRVVVDASIEAEFVATLNELVANLNVGDPASPETMLGPLISEEEAKRVEVAISSAVGNGAQLHCGGQRTGAVISPAVLSNVDPDDAIAQEELFGPAVAITSVANTEQAIEVANSTVYGLAAGVFTGNMGDAIRAMREIDAGNVHINWTPLWRADLMPYGGIKTSGIGKEGVRSAVQEMTEQKTVVLHS